MEQLKNSPPLLRFQVASQPRPTQVLALWALLIPILLDLETRTGEPATSL